MHVGCDGHKSFFCESHLLHHNSICTFHLMVLVGQRSFQAIGWGVGLLGYILDE